jgi:DHA1 family multidrug resistance protein-like MFS transporter
LALWILGDPYGILRHPNLRKTSANRLSQLAGPICILLNLFLAETSAPSILHRRAQRLRALTKSDRFRSYSEIQQSHLTASAVFVDAIIKPIEICLKDPAVTFANLYTSLIYSVYYSFFVAVPLVFPTDYGFDLGELGLVYSCILVACALGATAYASYIYFVLNPRLKAAKEEPPQEYRLVPALVAVFLPPVGLFLFGWTARADIHWIVPIIGITIFSSGIFVVLQCISIYIPRIYPQYHASLFAANDFCRSALAAGAIHFASPLYTNLGIGKGVSVLAGISVLGIVGMWILWGFGAKLRARSSFAVS